MCKGCTKGHQKYPGYFHHEIVNWDAINKELKEKAMRKVSHLDQMQAQLSTNVDELSTQSESISKTSYELMSQVNSEAEKFHKVIEDQRFELIKEVRGFHEKKMSKFDNLKRDIQTQIDAIGSLKSAIEETEVLDEVGEIESYMTAAEVLMRTTEEDLQERWATTRDDNFMTFTPCGEIPHDVTLGQLSTTGRITFLIVVSNTW